MTLTVAEGVQVLIQQWKVTSLNGMFLGKKRIKPVSSFSMGGAVA